MKPIDVMLIRSNDYSCGSISTSWSRLWCPVSCSLCNLQNMCLFQQVAFQWLQILLSDRILYLIFIGSIWLWNNRLFWLLVSQPFNLFIQNSSWSIQLPLRIIWRFTKLQFFFLIRFKKLEKIGGKKNSRFNLELLEGNFTFFFASLNSSFFSRFLFL